MARIVPILRAWLRKASQLRSIDATLTGPKFPIPLRIDDEPQETRRGQNEQDRAPFYEMNADKLWGYYHGYKGYQRRYGPYADFLAFQTEELRPIWPNCVRTESVKIQLYPPYRLPSELKAHSHVALDFFKKLKKINREEATGTWKNNLSIRLTKIDGSVFHCEPVNYIDQVATNLTVDWASGQLPGGADTIRSGIERPRDGKLPPLEDSLLANNFGTAIMFYDRDLTRVLLRLRAEDLAAISQKAFHSTVSGVLKMPPDHRLGEHGFDFLLNGTRQEIKDETNLDPHQYLLFPVAMARELPRAGKPQLFFVAISLVDDETFERECQNAKERNEYLTSDQGTFFTALEKSHGPLRDKFTYEGWASQLMAENFLEHNGEAIKNKLADAVP